jgi:hypothetical protein
MFLILISFLTTTFALTSSKVFASTIPSLRITYIGQTTKLSGSDSSFFYYGPLTNFQANNHNTITIGTQYPVIQISAAGDDSFNPGVYVDGTYLGDVSNSHPTQTGVEEINFQETSSNSYTMEFILTNLTPGTHDIEVWSNPISGSVHLIKDYSTVTIPSATKN